MSSCPFLHIIVLFTAPYAANVQRYILNQVYLYKGEFANLSETCNKFIRLLNPFKHIVIRIHEP